MSMSWSSKGFVGQQYRKPTAIRVSFAFVHRCEGSLGPETAQVSADNPRLSNPEISKIIGRQWREEAPCVQGKWQRMAQKEKEYHRQQHPNYRYRPRRGPRPNDGRRSGSAPTEGSSKCSRCNGNLASAPRNGSTQSRDGRTGNRLARQPEEPPHSPDTDVARWTSDEPSPMPGPRLPLSRGPGGYEPETMEVRRYREDDTGDYHLVSGHPGFYGGISPVEPRILASRPAYMRPSFAPIPTPASQSPASSSPSHCNAAVSWTDNNVGICLLDNVRSSANRPPEVWTLTRSRWKRCTIWLKGSFIAVEGPVDGLPKRRSKFGRADDALLGCLWMVFSWHEVSHEIVDYVTGVDRNDRRGEQLPAQPQGQNGNRSAAGSKRPIAWVTEFSSTLAERFACDTLHRVLAQERRKSSTTGTWIASPLARHCLFGPDLMMYGTSCCEDELGTLCSAEISRRMGVILVRVEPSLAEAWTIQPSAVW
ncbi:snf2 family helicase [Trichoderma cornu-damae]|uniref:Snf2 family helicase n=1 Tax=Trichoderma cornu-damae TaxID=654480 RepID=A0A9P8QV28_9HYPO|nr:snf2 family helicase [Trichoderma cornu-damae]